MTGALDGLLVVSLEQAVAAPYCSCRLADAGARVIKIERPEGGDFARAYDRVVDGESAYFVWLNRGKESLTLDIKQTDDAALLRRILAKADVFIQNLGPGAAARAGFGSADLRAAHPRLVTCDISGYGEDGPYRDMKAYDLLVQAESGLASITGVPEGPGRVGASVTDIGAGMYAYMAILEALMERARTGRGKGLAVSLFHAMADWMAVPLLYHDYGDRDWPRVGLYHPSIAPYGAYATGDGRQILIGVQNDAEWGRFAGTVLQREDLADDPRFHTNVERRANRPELDREIDAVFATLSYDEIEQRLRDAGIAYGALNGVAELSAHPQIRRLHYGTPSGSAKVAAPPAMAANGRRDAGPVPSLGQHSAAIRREFAA